jgi:hypothetical protein
MDNQEPYKPDFTKIIRRLSGEDPLPVGLDCRDEYLPAEPDTYSDIPLSQEGRRRLFEEILEASPTQALGDGPPSFGVNKSMAKRLRKMAKEFGTSDQRIFEAAFIAWTATEPRM